MTGTASHRAEASVSEPRGNGLSGAPFAGARVAAAGRPKALPSWSWGAIILAGLGGWSLFIALGYAVYRLLFV